jgi:hypothetical protein
MKRMLLAIMAVAVAISFSAPSFAGETEKPKDEKKGKKETHMIYAGEERRTRRRRTKKK